MIEINDNDELDKFSSSLLPSVPSSPSKKNQPEIQRRKKFQQRKHELASSFLKDLDQTITSGHISSLTLPTGGIQIIWSNKLQSTAGRACWKVDHMPSESSDDFHMKTKRRHHAKIELAEKVIDDEGE